MKATTERNQRQLHRLTRRAEEALSQPAAAVLASASKVMGFADLTSAAESVPGVAASGAQTSKDARGSKCKAVQPLDPEQVGFSWASLSRDVCSCSVQCCGMPFCSLCMHA